MTIRVLLTDLKFFILYLLSDVNRLYVALALPCIHRLYLNHSVPAQREARRNVSLPGKIRQHGQQHCIEKRGLGKPFPNISRNHWLSFALSGS